MPFNKREVLLANIEGREQEIGMYEINIDAYERSLVAIDEQYAGDDDIHTNMRTEHKQRIEELLTSEKRECEKARLSLQVLQAQIEALNE